MSCRAGFGKSHVARFLVDVFRFMDQRVAVTGTTATAAGNIGGVTLHRFRQFSKGFESRLDQSKPLWPSLKGISVVIINEITMATAHLFAVLCTTSFAGRRFRTNGPLLSAGRLSSPSGIFADYRRYLLAFLTWFYNKCAF